LTRTEQTTFPNNVDVSTVAGFGYEWGRFTQSELGSEERRRLFDAYFSSFPWEYLPPGGGVGADIGCGSGRWSLLVAPRVARLHLVDASEAALEVAKTNLAKTPNVEFHLSSVAALPFSDNSLDFAFSLGVLHHVPDTFSAIRSIAGKLKPGAPLLIYLYYAFDNRPFWYRILWKASNLGRLAISRLPKRARYASSQLLALTVYWPLARTARLLECFHVMPEHWPLKHYREASFYVMRTDALDRFGTRLEQRFSQRQIQGMLEAAGFVKVRFSSSPPYWCAVGIKTSRDIS
jgi:ubiquinone/menaquinone biosynthesis C-methylase UbiE